MIRRTLLSLATLAIVLATMSPSTASIDERIRERIVTEQVEANHPSANRDGSAVHDAARSLTTPNRPGHQKSTVAESQSRRPS